MNYKSLKTLLVLILLLPFSFSYGQTEDPVCTVDEGYMRIVIPRELKAEKLDSISKQYDLGSLQLRSSFETGDWHNALEEGWIVKQKRKSIVLSKPLQSWDQQDLGDMIRIMFRNTASETPAQPGVPQLFEPYGINDLKFKTVVKTSDSTARFFFRINENVSKVYLSGSFNNWSTLATPMEKTDSAWTVEVALPAGKHLYKLIVDGNWIGDPGNNRKEEDGYYDYNSVYYQTNHTFFLKGHLESTKVFLAGSFNGWNDRRDLMEKTATGWELDAFIKQGTYTYKFIADGNWMSDPENLKKVGDGNGNFNSVLTVGDAFTFRLRGFPEAKNVILSGNFNEWNPDDLRMIKTEAGWELPYVLGPGNYSYKFVVDGEWIMDPANPSVIDDGAGVKNSLIVIKGNYTFSLPGFDTAKEVIVAGSFNNWDEHAFRMKKVGDSWQFTAYLEPGKHLYKFIVDGSWIVDPTNELWEENEHSTGNSVLWISSLISFQRD